MIYQFFLPLKGVVYGNLHKLYMTTTIFLWQWWPVSSSWKWNLDHAIVPLKLKRWTTIASTIWCTLYISFLLKRNFVYSFVETQTSLSRNKMGNKYNHVCVLMSTGYRHLKHVKKDWKHRNLHHTWIHSRSLQVFNKNKKSAQPVELQMVQ